VQSGDRRSYAASRTGVGVVLIDEICGAGISLAYPQSDIPWTPEGARERTPSLMVKLAVQILQRDSVWSYVEDGLVAGEGARAVPCQRRKSWGVVGGSHSSLDASALPTILFAVYTVVRIGYIPSPDFTEASASESVAEQQQIHTVPRETRYSDMVEGALSIRLVLVDTCRSVRVRVVTL
jgi:hypothetical protein